MNKFHYSITAIAGGLSLSLGLGGTAIAEQNVCDMKILNRPGCEVGDFGVHFSPEIMINERSVIRDFREAPTMPQMIQLPSPQNNFGGGPTSLSRDVDDESTAMRAAWEEWHARVASYAFKQFSLTKAAFYRSGPISAVAAYTVTSDGRILNAHLTQASTNPIYNALVLRTINSMNGNLQLLQFPQGSRRAMIDKTGTFMQNTEPIGDFGSHHRSGGWRTPQKRK